MGHAVGNRERRNEETETQVQADDGLVYSLSWYSGPQDSKYLLKLIQQSSAVGLQDKKGHKTTGARGSHIHLACRSVCDRDQES